MKKRNLWLGIAFFFCVLFLIFFEINYTNISHYQLHFLNIEEGDAIFIQTPEEKNILIDTGKFSNIGGVLAKYMNFFNRDIDLLILSHMDADHIGGAIEILKTQKVHHILFHGAEKNTPVFKVLKEQIVDKKIGYTILESEKDFQIDENIILDVLYPFENISYLTNSSNNESLVFHLSFFGKKILFTGDIEAEVEEMLLKSGESLSADILKVAHHGSKTSSTQSFIDAVSPRVAIAQAAENNRFGHPHKEVVERFEANNVKFLHTGVEGNISFCISEEKQEFFRCN